MSGHTPGPWEAFASVVRTTGIMGEVAEDMFVADMVGPLRCGEWRSTMQREADARLIAAAPEMLAALKLVRRCMFPDPTVTTAVLERIDEIIRKAEG